MDAEAMMGMAIAPIIVFLIFVAPIWIILHYRSKKKISEGLSSDDASQIQELVEKAEQLKERVRTLEHILDQENPNWRRYE